ncbi:carbohydrate kinase family protein [Stutzerimonas nitrititolerans]|uniref:carbohydrate kinase family protein n=1 Tax=Stutzerimonas nitrititolerans TaxID=2482751 RepID=UPI00289C3405|nr:carbohydrate kinase [Stutzerimonas nitrititolerans]
MYLICGEALFDVFTASGDGPGNLLTLEAVAGGSPFNVAVGLSRLGVPAALLGGISNDSFGERLRQILSDEGVLDDYLVPFEAPTTLAMVALGADGSPRYSFRGEGCADRLLREAHLRPLADDIGAIHVGSYSMVVPPIADTLHALVSRESHRRLISMDPNVRPTVEPSLPRWRERVEAFARHAHLIKASDEDLALLYPGEAPERIALGWLKDRCELVLLTRGSKGAQLFSRRHGQFHAAARPTVVRDTVGAGDTFQAALLAYLHEQGVRTAAALAELGRDQLESMLGFAVQAAAITCSRTGPDLPCRYEIDWPASQHCL